MCTIFRPLRIKKGGKMKLIVGISLIFLSHFLVANVIFQGTEPECNHNEHSPAYCSSIMSLSSTSGYPTLLNGNADLEISEEEIMQILLETKDVHLDLSPVPVIDEMAAHYGVSPQDIQMAVSSLDERGLKVSFENLNKELLR